MSERDDVPTPLPHRARFAIQAFRKVKPSQALEERIWNALDTVDRSAERPREEKSKPPSGRKPLVFVVALAVCMFALLGFVVVRGVRGVQPAGVAGVAAGHAHELAVKIPDEGDTWVELPLSTHHHAPHAALVHFDAPASIRLHVPYDPAPEDRETDCTEKRCVHRWRTPTQSPRRSNPRVQIKEPGRYEFHVKHTSPARSYQERFVVLATR